jgi:hypothetical protein
MKKRVLVAMSLVGASATPASAASYACWAQLQAEYDTLYASGVLEVAGEAQLQEAVRPAYREYLQNEMRGPGATVVKSYCQTISSDGEIDSLPRNTPWRDEHFLGTGAVKVVRTGWNKVPR